MLAATYWAIAVRAPSGPRSLRVFDADRLAELEVGMWQAYYAKDKSRLFRLLVVMLREQYHYSWQKAVRAGYQLARAAATFGDATGDYDRVLPDLDGRVHHRARLDGREIRSRAVARAELSWWTARRDPASGTRRGQERASSPRA